MQKYKIIAKVVFRNGNECLLRSELHIKHPVPICNELINVISDYVTEDIVRKFNCKKEDFFVFLISVVNETETRNCEIKKANIDALNKFSDIIREYRAGNM